MKPQVSIWLEVSQHMALGIETDAPREEPFKEVPQEGNAESDSQHAQLLARLLLALFGVQRLDQSTSCKSQQERISHSSTADCAQPALLQALPKDHHVATVRQHQRTHAYFQN